MALSIDEIVSLFHTWGNENYDEDVTQLAHARQCAALALREGATDELCIAALLHDVGHLFEIAQQRKPSTSEDHRHELTGSAFISELFPVSVTDPIALHVDAKRYLTATDTTYFESLSDGSKRSLSIQGGAFTDREALDFISRAGSSEALRLRRWDDHGKVIGLDVPDFDSWIPTLRRVAVR